MTLQQPNIEPASIRKLADTNWMLAVSINTLLMAMFVLTPGIFAQNPQQTAANPRPKQDERPLPPPANVSLETKDRVLLKCTYYAAPSNEQTGSGKSVMPFMLVHDWEGSRQDMLPFAEFLQSSGYAVIVPDLRGHGESTGRVGMTGSLNYKKFRKSDLNSVVMDLERCKKYLVKRNNDGELNVDLLNVVAVGKSAVFAMDWTIADWSWDNRGPIKQGKDVKSLTLISPQKKVKNIGLSQSIRHPLFSGRAGDNLPTLVLWSVDDDFAADDSDSIYRAMEKGRPDLSKIDDPDKRDEEMTLYKGEIPNSRSSGTELMSDNRRNIWQYIAKFVEFKVGSEKDDHRWQSRERD